MCCLSARTKLTTAVGIIYDHAVLIPFITFISITTHKDGAITKFFDLDFELFNSTPQLYRIF